MALGVPVVASTAGALPEVLGDAALLVAPGDAEALGAAIGSVLDDSRCRERLVAAGFTRAGVFTNAASAEAMSSVYFDLAST